MYKQTDQLSFFIFIKSGGIGTVYMEIPAHASTLDSMHKHAHSRTHSRVHMHARIQARNLTKLSSRNV